MPTSTVPHHDVSSASLTEEHLIWCHERITRLENELQSAQARISQQQEKLKLLVDALRASRVSTEPRVSAPAAPSLTDAEIAQPGHPYRKLAPQTNLATPATPAARLPITGTESALWVAGLWKTVPAWSKGILAAEDAAFLNAVIEKARPDYVYEIGVASGTSSALILGTMAPYADPFRVWLYSYDITGKCYFDPARAVGEATREMVPALLEHWKLNTASTALDVARDRQLSSRPLYFIDANHTHPWPVLDLIALLPVLKPGDCVVLHDINLPTMTAGEFPDYGAQWLMEDWTGPRLVPDVALPNIGAIFIPEDPRVLLSSLVKTLSRPWPHPLTSSHEKNHLQACERRLADHLRRNGLGT